MIRDAYVFLNGYLEGKSSYFKDVIKKFPGDIYCADGGYKHCLKMGLLPLEVWGDMDSLSKADLKKIEEKNIKIQKFSAEKDKTDGELLIQYVSSKKYDKIFVIGGLGGDRAHEFTNLNLMAKYKNIVFLTEKEKIFFLKNSEVLNLQVGTQVSFVPMSDIVKKLTLKGFQYPLENYNLERGDSRCMSNIVNEEITRIIFDSGLLMGIIKN